MHPFTLADSQAQSSAHVERRLHQAVATLNALRTPYLTSVGFFMSHLHTLVMVSYSLPNNNLYIAND